MPLVDSCSTKPSYRVAPSFVMRFKFSFKADPSWCCFYNKLSILNISCSHRLATAFVASRKLHSVKLRFFYCVHPLSGLFLIRSAGASNTTTISRLLVRGFFNAKKGPVANFCSASLVRRKDFLAYCSSIPQESLSARIPSVIWLMCCYVLLYHCRAHTWKYLHNVQMKKDKMYFFHRIYTLPSDAVGLLLGCLLGGRWFYCWLAIGLKTMLRWFW